jgi:glucose-1-phosphate thymidylyltransferase
MLRNAGNSNAGATVFAYQVRDPERYGVVSFDNDGYAVELAEKPAVPKSNWAVTGLYFYDNDVVSYSHQIKPSHRGELEITDINQCYLDAGKLQVAKMGRGFAWLDTGTFTSLVDAALFVQTLEERQGEKIACLEEIAFGLGFIDRGHLMDLAGLYRKSGYGDYLERVAVA